MIEVKDLVKTYGNKFKPAVNNVSFSIGKGEIVGLLGPNGAGKSTIMKIITGYLNQTEGEVFVNGKNRLDAQIEIKSMIGYLPERTPLYNDMYVYEYLEFVAEVRGIEKDKIFDSINKMIELVDIKNVISKKIGELSNGYKKRVGLAASMIHDPEILILDEPTAGLDPNQIIMFRKILRRLSEQKTIILSTHILSEIEAMCERVIIINNGKKVADDTLQDLLNKFNKEVFVDFVVEAESLKNVEESLNNIKGAWKVEFEKKDGKKLFRFKALTSTPDEFENNLKSMSNEKNWKITNIERNKANLEEIFLKLTDTGDNNE